MVEFAVAYSKLGWHVFPCYPMRGQVCGCGRAQCTSPGKHPATDNGLSEATTDEAQIRLWWEYMPDASIGVHMERSGLCALDLDDYETKEVSDLVLLAHLEQSLGVLPTTVLQLSGSGEGYHAVFKAPGFPVRGLIGGIVVRSKAYIIVAPSNHESGGHYTWQEGCGPTDIPVAEFPDTWKAALEKKAEIGHAGVPAEEPEWLQAIPAEQRLADARAHIARERGEIKGQSKAGTTFDVVRSFVRRYALRDPEQALELAQEYDQKCVPPWRERIARHVWSAYNKATEPPWGYAYRGEQERRALPAVPDITVSAALESIKAKRPSDPQKIQDREIVKRVLDGKFLGDDDGLAAETLLRVCPAGTSDAQIIGLLTQCMLPSERAEELVRTIRMANAAKVTNLGDLMPADVVIDGVNLGPTMVLPDPDALEMPEQSAPSSDRDLLGKLRMSEDGTAVTSCPHNLSLIIQNDSRLGNNVQFNELTKEIRINVAPFDKNDPNTVITKVRNYLDIKWHCHASSADIKEQILLAARENSFNPVADYLLPIAATWDRVPRNDTWLIDYCGAEDNEFNRRVGAMWLIAACARGIKPGSKVDNVLILEGRQGTKKSSTFKALGGPWFSGSPVSINTKDGQQMMSFCWIVELAELASLRSSETEAQKQFLTVDHDVYRPPYGSAPERFPRFAVCGGTTNDEDGYLPDKENRRYWPVAVGHRINTLRLMQDRDQLWAEAAYRYLNSDVNPHLAHPECPGERWWFETEAEEDMARGVVDKRRPENVWASRVREWVGMQVLQGSKTTMWTLGDIAEKCLRIDIEKLNGPKQKQLTAAAKEAGLVATKGEGGRPMWRAPDSMIARIVETSGTTAVQPPTTN